MKQQLRVLFFCVFVVMIGYGLGLPLLPYYIERLVTDAGETAHQAAFHVGLSPVYLHSLSSSLHRFLGDGRTGPADAPSS